MRRFAAAGVVLVLLAGCGDDGDGARDASTLDDCAAARRSSAPRPAYLPAAVLPDGAKVMTSTASGGRALATLAVPGTIERAFDAIRAGARSAGLEVTGEDNEGFKAELSLRSDADLVAMW